MEPEVTNEAVKWLPLVLGVLLALSELIGATKLKSNGVFQLFVNVLKTLAGKQKK